MTNSCLSKGGSALVNLDGTVGSISRVMQSD
jgi:hypothetical protein